MDNSPAGFNPHWSYGAGVFACVHEIDKERLC